MGYKDYAMFTEGDRPPTIVTAPRNTKKGPRDVEDVLLGHRKFGVSNDHQNGHYHDPNTSQATATHRNDGSSTAAGARTRHSRRIRASSPSYVLFIFS